MTYHYSDLGSASDRLKQTFLVGRPIRSTDHIWVVTRYQYECHFVGNQSGIFFSLKVYERVGISLVEVYKRVGKSVILVCKRAQKGLQMNCLALKSRENVLFL